MYDSTDLSGFEQSNSYKHCADQKKDFDFINTQKIKKIFENNY